MAITPGHPPYAHQGLPGRILEGQRLEEWCYHACKDPRDWYIPEERYVAIAAANEKLRQVQRTRNPSYKPEIYIVEGDTGAGKSATCTYFNLLWALRHGADLCHNGMMGPGRHLEGGQLEWITAMDRIKAGTLVWLDEAASIIRHGRDGADIQEFFNQSATGIRKQNAKLGLSSAMDYRIGGVARGTADRFWLPEKLELRLDRKSFERLRKALPKGETLTGKNDPRNFAYRLLTTSDKPFRPASTFDPVTGRADKPREFYEQALSVRWMQTVMPCLDTFQSVPLGAGLTAGRSDLMGYLNGRSPNDVPDGPAPLRPADVMRSVYAAFEAGDIAVKEGAHLKTTELLYVLRQHEPNLRPELLTYTLKAAGLAERKGQGWNQVAVLSAMVRFFDRAETDAPSDWEDETGE